MFPYANDQLRTQYIRGRGAAALGFEGKYYGSHRDEQGSICWLSGEQGQVENAYEYDAFGVVKNQQGNLPNRLLYTGEQYDQETQQYYVRARYYNPVIGRFTQEDTYRGDGLNLYAYCHNNPVMYYDPSGHAYNSTKKEENAKNQNATEQGKNSAQGNGVPVKEKTTASNGFDYQSNSKHTPGQPGNRPNAGVEPKNSLDLFGESVSSTSKPNQRFTFDAKTNTLHRFFYDKSGTWHWSGSTNQGVNSLMGNQVPNEIKKIFNLPKKGW